MVERDTQAAERFRKAFSRAWRRVRRRRWRELSGEMKRVAQAAAAPPTVDPAG